MVRNDVDPQEVLMRSQAIARLRGMCDNDEQLNAVDALQSTNDVYFRNGIMHVAPRRSRSFTPLPSPCYSITHTLLHPLELPSNSAAAGRKIESQMQCMLKVPELLDSLSACATDSRKTEVQLR
ncbi:hypothetical protein PMAYCL1PPCAC_23237, partial [Pristionchus mayeri]